MVRQGQGGDYFRLLGQGRVRFPAKLKFLVCWGKQAAELLREDSHGHNPQATMPLKRWNKHCSEQALLKQVSAACRRGWSAWGRSLTSMTAIAECPSSRLSLLHGGSLSPWGSTHVTLSSSCRAGLGLQGSSRDLVMPSFSDEQEGRGKA